MIESTADTSKFPPLIRQDDKVVLFDGVCRFCSFWARVLLRFDHRGTLSLATMQSPEGQAILRWFHLPTDQYESMVLVEGSRGYFKSAAVIRIAIRLPAPWPTAGLLWLIPWFVRDWIYDWIARNRYAMFGKNKACMLPTPEQQKRFLSARIKEPAPATGICPST